MRDTLYITCVIRRVKSRSPNDSRRYWLLPTLSPGETTNVSRTGLRADVDLHDDSFDFDNLVPRQRKYSIEKRKKPMIDPGFSSPQYKSKGKFAEDTRNGGNTGDSGNRFTLDLKRLSLGKSGSKVSKEKKRSSSKKKRHPESLSPPR